MDTSNVIAVSNGIVTLSNCEIDLVSGGKSLIQKLWDSISGFFNGDCAPPPPNTQISMTDLNELEKTCVESGGNFSFTSGYATGGVNLRVTAVDGTYSWVNVQCTQP